MGEFTIKKKCFDGIELIGYILEGDNGKESKVKKQDVLTLLSRGMITNAKRVLDSDIGEYTMCILDDIDTESKDKLEIVGRVLNGNKECTGYIARDTNGNNHRLSTKSAWIKALNNNIINVDAKIICGRKSIISNTNKKLADLPVLEEN